MTNVMSVKLARHDISVSTFSHVQFGCSAVAIFGNVGTGDPNGSVGKSQHFFFVETWISILKSHDLGFFFPHHHAPNRRKQLCRVHKAQFHGVRGEGNVGTLLEMKRHTGTVKP